MDSIRYPALRKYSSSSSHSGGGGGGGGGGSIKYQSRSISQTSYHRGREPYRVKSGQGTKQSTPNDIFQISGIDYFLNNDRINHILTYFVGKFIQISIIAIFTCTEDKV